MPTTTIPTANSHLINLSAASEMTDRYRNNRNSILQTTYQSSDLLPLSETFNVNDINLLISQTGCEAIRIYYGMTDNLQVHAILVAVDEGNADIIPDPLDTSNINENVIVEEGQRCPSTMSTQLATEQLKKDNYALLFNYVIVSFSIWIAAVAGLVRIKNSDAAYHPFIILCWTGAINELLSFLLTRSGYSTNANNNIYLLAESLLLLWQFKKWVPEAWMKRYFLLLVSVLLLTWFFEYNTVKSLVQIRYYFRFLYAVVIIFLSMTLMQRLVIEHATGLGKTHAF